MESPEFVVIFSYINFRLFLLNFFSKLLFLHGYKSFGYELFLSLRNYFQWYIDLLIYSYMEVYHP